MGGIIIACSTAFTWLLITFIVGKKDNYFLSVKDDI